MNALYPAVANQADHRCEYCHAPEVVFNTRFEVEHIIPTSRGGDDNVNNLALACSSCNRFKSNRETANDELGNAVALFHPRHDDWKHHFRIDSETGQIIGMSATGRVTVRVLQMNADKQTEARRMWMRLNLYP